MINRAKMPRQLRDKGGIASVTPRKKYGLGSKLKERFRKLVPNELADIAVKAAPFVAPFNPGIAGLMRGIGRFDQRGSISDAFKQGVGTFAAGQLFRQIGGAGTQKSFLGTPGDRFTSPLSADRTTAIKDFFNPQEKLGSTYDEAGLEVAKPTKGTTAKTVAGGPEFVTKTTKATIDKIPIINKLPEFAKSQILVGGATGAITYVYEAFLKEEPPQEEGETYDEYMARRKENVGRKMKSYFDNYFKFDKDYSNMTDEQKEAFIARVNVKDGGRIGYQTGGVTMANTLAENIRRNLANQAAVAQQFRQARRNIPGFIEPVVPPAPKAAPIKIEEPDLPISKPVQPPGGDVQPMLPGPGGIDRLLPDLYEKVVGPAPEQPSTPPRVVTKPVDIVDLYEKAVSPAEPPPLIDDLIKLPVEPRTDQDLIEGFAKFKEQNPEVMQGAGTMALIEGILPDGTPITFSGSLESNAFNKYLESLGLSRADIVKPRENIESLKKLAKLAKGGIPTGIMRTNKAGVMERDYRDKGGFVPVGIKEKADDVPAMLSKNEFVFTADAVRGAGNGSIEKGAQRMYDTMKKLEKRVV